MIRLVLVALCCALAAGAHAQGTQPYRLYTGTGAPTTLEALVADVARAEVVFLGEVHDDSVAHALQAELLERLLADPKRPTTLSLEMFERDVQLVLDEYLGGLIPEEQFLRAARPWPNYAAHYRPLVEAARAAGRPVIAANAPRRYVNRVARLGPASLDSLSGPALLHLAPLPYPSPSPGYRAKWDALMAEMGHDSGSAAPAPSNMLWSQSLWDATMAQSIAWQLTRHPRARVVHVVGGFHVEGGLGTPAVLQQYRPATQMKIVVMRPVADVTAFDAEQHAGLGDYVVLTDASLLPPRTF